MKKAKDLELLIKYCEPVSDDEEKLLICPFEYEYDGSPQSSPSAAVSTPSEPTGILMLSVPSTDSDGESSAHENEEYETPPEQNNSSQQYFSGSDELKPSTSAVGEVTEAVDLGNDDDELRFSNRRESNERETGEFEGRSRKRYRVSEEEMEVKKEPIVIEIDQTQTQGVDTEVVECEKNVEVDEHGVGRNADDSTVKMSERDVGEMRKNGERGVDEDEKLNGSGDDDGDGERGVVSMNLDENEKLKDGVHTKEMHSNGIARNVGDSDGERGVMSIHTKEMHSDGIARSVGDGDGDGDGERGVVSTNLDENEKLKDGVGAKEMHSNGIMRNVGDDGCGKGGSGVKGRRELPLSIRGGDKKDGPLEEVGRRATKCDGTFNNLVEAFSMVVGDVSSVDNIAADFLETAKSRGLTFPQPRWWPPEGFAD
ncbi:hypothetical protein FXO37_24181 [Capsicum annuum]|nr:hypothetical protein FXO37_24181 [Capsicum annuum]